MLAALFEVLNRFTGSGPLGISEAKSTKWPLTLQYT